MSNEYELLYQFETVFRDGEHKTQAASRDYSKVWESIIDNPPDEGVTPIHVYRLNGTTCAVIAGMDELVENEECAMEIARLAAEREQLLARIAELEAMVPKLVTVKEFDEYAGRWWLVATFGHYGEDRLLIVPMNQPIPLPKEGG